MDDKRKILNAAFAVSLAFVFGDHLSFTAGVNREKVITLICAKLSGGINALVLVFFLRRKEMAD